MKQPNTRGPRSDQDLAIAIAIMNNLRNSASDHHAARDRIAFQYLAAIAAVALAAATGKISIGGFVTEMLSASIPIGLCVIGIYTLLRRQSQTVAVYRAHVAVEDALTCFTEGTIIPDRSLLPKSWLDIDEYIGLKQAGPHVIALIFVTIIAVLLVLAY